jgi:hypothetical protein
MFLLGSEVCLFKLLSEKAQETSISGDGVFMCIAVFKRFFDGGPQELRYLRGDVCVEKLAISRVYDWVTFKVLNRRVC